jgi:uncharacterized protein YdhG (YjbR/CyaY superfamily)
VKGLPEHRHRPGWAIGRPAADRATQPKEHGLAAPTSVEDYLAALSDPSRAALEGLRAMIRAAAPGATEAISYGMPAFRYRGRSVVGYAAFRDHCSLFPMSMAVIEANEAELAPFRGGKGTLHFTGDRPLPAELVTRIVSARIAEIEVRPRRVSARIRP